MKATLCLLLGSLAAVACSSQPLYPNSTGSRGTTTRGNSGSSGGSGTSANDSGTTGGETTGGASTTSGTSGGPPGCEAACNLPGQFCDDAGQCVVCLDDKECSDSVEQPHCYNDAGPYFGTCVQCLVSDQCPQGEICDQTFKCIPGCVQTQNCTGPTPICEPDSGICVTCLSAAQCSNGLVCRQGACAECKSNYECYLNYPDLWTCSPEANCVQCEIDDDCPAGQHCIGTGCN